LTFGFKDVQWHSVGACTLFPQWIAWKQKKEDIKKAETKYGKHLMKAPTGMEEGG